MATAPREALDIEDPDHGVTASELIDQARLLLNHSLYPFP